jgi:hypothetical protein
MPNSTQITDVAVQSIDAADVGHRICAVPGGTQGSLRIGNVGVIIGGAGSTPTSLRREAYAMSAIAQHAEALAEQLVTLAETLDDRAPHPVMSKRQHTTYEVGDSDPTVNTDGTCGASHATYLCTWSTGHDGPHVAGTGVTVAAVWPLVERVPS